MVYDTLGEYTCRSGTEADLQILYTMLEDKVYEDLEHQSMQDMYKRKLKKYLKYALEKGSIAIVEKQNTITGVYVGHTECITYLINFGDIKSLALLLNTVLNGIENKHKESVFKVINKKQYDTWVNTKALGEKAVTIDEQGNGIISLNAKEKIQYLYNTLKGAI